CITIAFNLTPQAGRFLEKRNSMDIYGYLNNSKPSDATSQVNSCLDYISNTQWVVTSKIKLGCADIYTASL
ncbi:MAG: hypothetical protein ACI9FR_003380, partial [Cryomorphaceae bacterium]